MADKKKEWEIEGYYSPYTQISKDALEKWQNRGEFEYDLNNDALYNQYKNSYVEQGKLAAKDTIGQVSSLTGGYGNSYAQTAGQQTYQNYLQQLNDKVPELYNLQYNKWLQEGDDLYKQWQIATSLENQDYDRFITERQYEADEAYRKWQMSRSGSGSSSSTTVAFDNGKISEDNIKLMQEYLGVTPTGHWDEYMYNLSGGKTADEAWSSYNNTYNEEDGTLVRGLVADKNYASSTHNYPTNTSYTYVKNMFAPEVKGPTPLTEAQSSNLNTLYKRALESKPADDEKYSKEWNELWNLYVNLRNQGIDVSEWTSVFSDDFINNHM